MNAYNKDRKERIMKEIFLYLDEFILRYSKPSQITKASVSLFFEEKGQNYDYQYKDLFREKAKLAIMGK